LHRRSLYQRAPIATRRNADTVGERRSGAAQFALERDGDVLVAEPILAGEA
jgi:hypothetical protein